MKFSQTPQDVGANFFSFCFSFSHLLVIVYSFSFRSGISLITLLCYVLYVNFVIVYYLALIYYQFYGSISVTTFVEVGFFLGGPDHQPCIPQHLISSFVFIVFSLISFCSRFKVVFQYCNYYFFAFCRNLLFHGFLVKHLLIESLRVVFGIGPCPFILYGIGPCPFMDYNIYNNPKYSNNTFQTFKENYSPSLSFGAFIIDNLALTDEQRTRDDKILDMLIQNSASALVTDDIPRLRKKLGRTSKGAPTGQPSTSKIALVHFGTALFVCFFHF